MTAQETAQQALDNLGLTVRAEFVPWSQSNHYVPGSKKVSDRSLNWKVTLLKNGREILTTNYSAGIGHCPSYRPTLGNLPPDEAAVVMWECEHGFQARKGTIAGSITPKLVRDGDKYKRAPILPDPCDVVSCLLSDSDALDQTFEPWARDLGYNPDSKKAEAIYKACLDTAIKLRAGIGEDGLSELKAAFQDY